MGIELSEFSQWNQREHWWDWRRLNLARVRPFGDSRISSSHGCGCKSQSYASFANTWWLLEYWPILVIVLYCFLSQVYRPSRVLYVTMINPADCSWLGDSPRYSNMIQTRLPWSCSTQQCVILPTSSWQPLFHAKAASVVIAIHGKTDAFCLCWIS